MAKSTDPAKLTRLSEMKKGETYSLQADNADATLRVIAEGTTPVCLAMGTFNDSPNKNTVGPMTVQLLGWALLDDEIVQSDFNLFKPDVQPDSAWLVALYTDISPVPFLMAIGPEIHLKR